MIKNYLKITFRSLWKSKVFVLINIIGMGLAIACSIVAYLNYDFNANFDSNQADTENVYRIDGERTYREREQAFGISPVPIGEAIRENIGDIDAVMRYMPSGGNFKIGDELFNENFTFVDTNFFDFFTFNITKGDASVLKDKSSILISQRVVEKYFPDGDAMGKTLTHFTDDGPRDYKVAGIFEDQPLNSSFGGQRILTNIDNFFDMNSDEENGRYEEDWQNWVTTFVKVDNKDRISAIEERLDANYLQIQNDARLDFKLNRYFLEPFEGMAYRAADDITYNHWLRSSMPPPAVLVPMIMAVLILLIACFNFTNTSMAIASKRLKEIGLRKVMGGVKSQLVIQFLLENLVLCFLSLIAGVIIAIFLVPAYSDMWGFLDIKLSFDQNINFYLFLIGVLTFTGVIAGSYPAFYVTSFEPASILKGTSKFGGVNKMTNVLLTLQFSISLIAIILGVVFYQNAIYQNELDYGYDIKGAISLYFDDADSYKAFETSIRNNPEILSIAGSEYQINRGYRNDPVKNADKEFDTDILHIGNDFFETMDFKLLDGRGFRKDSETDMQESVIVSEEMVKVFGWEKPLGQKLIWMDTVPLYVVGVMQDTYTNGLWSPIEPLMLRYVPEKDYHYLTVKTAASNLISTNEYLESEWKTMFPDKMYTGEFMDNQLSNASEVNTNILKMFSFLGVIATFMSIIGLFSIVSLNILKRMKEVGVRKVLGASVGHLMTILNKNFIIILLIASVIGSVLSYMMAGAFMEMIWTYHVDPGVMSFAYSILLLLAIAIATISIKVYKAATASPTETIRTE
ncbi:ABC transporter permease [Fulvivirga lutimaris]|uniref:ABC transporter permease n=1 Tax=Fulvivirga lutimaris TaxID=1819566 RepID=UPI0012BD2AE5|nr:ABC transporter permease [Fulvivirga lutimaris]MTI39800.1 ABC transporter permease [Fulvivirga lutimaris]